MAKDSVAPLEELASHVIPPAFPDRAVNKYPSLGPLLTCNLASFIVFLGKIAPYSPYFAYFT